MALGAPTARQIANETSGSTGNILRFFLDGASRDARAAATYRYYTWYRVHSTDRHAMLWGANFDSPEAPGLRGRLRQALHPLLFLSSFELDDAALISYLNALERFRPILLTSYPTPLVALCSAMPPGYRLPELKAVICSAEQLFPGQRALIEARLNRPVYDRYGSREFGNLAQECETHAGLHVAVDRVWLEIVDTEGRPCPPGEPGEILVTDFDNLVQPFVRYRTGDLARWIEGPCACGRTLPRIAGIEGRVLDLVHTPAGHRLAGNFWSFLLRKTSPRITEFQVMQDGADTVTIRLRTADGVPLQLDEIEFVRAQVHRAAPDLRWTLDMESPLEQTRAGKHRVVINRWQAPNAVEPSQPEGDRR